MKEENDSSVGRLIKLAGEPDVPSPEAMLRARAASEQAWRRMLAEPGKPAARRSKFLLPGLALAASLVLIVWMAVRPESRPAPANVAQVVNLSGTPAAGHDGRTLPLAVNAWLPAGTAIDSGDGRLALTLGGTLSLRVDRATRLRFDGASQVTLLGGSLYVDSGGINAHSPLRIRTPAGEISHIGTQFQVLVAGDLTRVQVREGRIRVEANGARGHDVAAGDALEVRGGEFVTLQGLASFGADWAWAASLAPVLEIENRPLSEFLAWLAREQGWRVHYASERLQEQAAQIRLHGSLEGLEVAAMLERVVLVTGVKLEVRHGVLWVGA